MSKPRRPRGPHATWVPKPPLTADRLATAEPVAEPATALPAAIAPELPPEIVERALARAAEAPATAAEPPARSTVPAAAGTGPAPDDGTAPAAAPRAAANANAAPAHRSAAAPDRLDVAEIGSTVARYMRGEGAAAMAHLQALSAARTPAELIRLQVGEVQRAADASLTCWVTVVRKAGRLVAFR